MGYVARICYLIGGGLCVLLAVLGVFLPLLPTTPFLILAAFCFSRSSERLHRWLLNQPTFGPMIHDWEQHGVIRRRTKCVSTALMLTLISYPMLFVAMPPGVKPVIAVTMLGVLTFIWTRPSQPRPVLPLSENSRS